MKYRIILLLMLLLPAAVMAQTQVSGTVTDGKGEAIIGASVTVKGRSGTGTVTDFDGNFRLNVPQGTTLVFSYIGMATKEVKVKGATLRVILEENQNVMSEVVVVGYGQQKKASVVGSIAQTTGKVLERAGGVSNIGAALTGNLPGVTTMASSGAPGDEDPKIVIRGITSWNSSEPLVLVDGIERPMSTIDINSVQSVSVLKDASATAVYGVKGANGVILITTKRGTEGKAKIEFGFNAVMKTLSDMPGVYGSPEALTIRNSAIEHELGLKPESWSKITPEAVIEKYRNPASIEEADRYPNVDWQKELFNDYGMSYNPNFSISGGTPVVRYFANIDYLHEGDMFKHYDSGRGYESGYSYDRINIRSNIDLNITKTTLLKANIFGSHGTKKRPWIQSDDAYFETGVWQAAYSAPPDAFLPRYSDGTWGYYPSDRNGAPNSMATLALGGVENRTTTRINTDFTLEQDLSFLLKGLKASVTVSWDNVFVERSRGINDLYHPTQYKWITPDTGETTWYQSTESGTNFDFQEGIKWSTNGGAVDNGATQRNLYYQGQIYWGGKFGRHDITAMGVFNRTERATGNEYTNYREDWAFRTTYNYDNRYFLEYNGAYNGSERFSSENRFAFFNSGAVGWMVSEEKWFEPIKKYIDMLKLRYSIGQVGDDNVTKRWIYATQWAYGSDNTHAGTIWQGVYEEASPYTWYRESQVGNPDVHWERATKQNFGVDYSFLGGLLAGSLEFFSERRNDILITGLNRSVPSYYGTTPPTANLGRVKSHGYELELRFNKRFGKDVRLWANTNMTHAVSKIIDADDPVLTPAYQKKAGYAIGQDHAYLTTGFANTWDEVIAMTEYNTNDDQKLPGQYTVIDYNGDGVIDSNDSAPYGYTDTPQYTYNATIGFEWKGLSLMVQFYGVRDVNRYVGFTSFAGKLNTLYDEGSLWTKYNTNADAPMPRWNSTPSYYEGTRFHYDGSYIRLKNAEIAYTFDSTSWIRHLGLNSLRIYLNGNNLWTYHHMPDDRESNYAGTGLATQGAYPTVKRFNLGIKLSL